MLAGLLSSRLMDGACHNCLLEALDDDLCPLCEGERRFANARELEAALRMWAARELGKPPSDAAFHEFVGATLSLADVGALYAAYASRSILERLCDPFDRAQGGAATVGPRSERAPTTERDRVPMVPLVRPEYEELQPPSSVRASLIAHEEQSSHSAQGALRAVLYPLASVAASDGVMELDERWYLDECLKRYGVAPSADGEIRVYHPLDYAALVPVEMREALLEDMCKLAMIDGLPDAAEARMIYAYCSEWRIPEERARAKLIEMQNENISLARRFWLGFRNYVLPGRWENTKL
jgi:hypothetical protein